MQKTKSLKELGYTFQDNLLVRKKSGEQFRFTNQQEYDELGEAVTEEIYEMIVNNIGLS